MFTISLPVGVCQECQLGITCALPPMQMQSNMRLQIRSFTRVASRREAAKQSCAVAGSNCASGRPNGRISSHFYPGQKSLTPSEVRKRLSNLRLLVGKDIGVTGIQDGHGAAAEELTASGTELDLYEGEQLATGCIPPKSTGDFFAG